MAPAPIPAKLRDTAVTPHASSNRKELENQIKLPNYLTGRVDLCWNLKHCKMKQDF